ncbi:MAG: GyrI-like domain-containing protein [Anaerolineae bacterium]
MESWDVPAQTYAVCPCTLKNIPETCKYIFGTWLPQLKYERGDGPDRIVYSHAGEVGLNLI